MKLIQNTLRKVNISFFIISVALPAVVLLLFLTVIFVFFVFPYLNFKVSRVFDNPVIPGGVKKVAGFDRFSFNELLNEASSSLAVKHLPATFSLTIPKLKIVNAKVETNAKSLSPDLLLGHYKGTSYPGEPGNALIYGHSVLPVFFNPHDYRTIFSTLPQLKEGDKFYVDFAGNSFTYVVVEKLTLKPSYVKVFEQQSQFLPKDSSTVTLLTCVPPGSKVLRLLIVGKLTN
ncbi:MAG: sortase [Patescibacteria group bacterium]